MEAGDTLYSIAWRYGLDFRALARANGIPASYRIYPGQRLTLSEAPKRRASTEKKAAQSSRQAPRSAAKAPVAKKAAPAPAQAPKQAVTSRSSSRSSAPAAGPLEWKWPAKGPVVGRFRTQGKINKGVNIAGNPGEPVFAAAPGEVVYSGSGLLGYGNLIIINHNERFLSAYAHNSRLLAKERDRVKTGEKIAEIGNTGASQPMLHFEIRKDGKPVDPLRYLPKRK
ncbi:peptidoglycan DD-metalloendopeptidase family protein [Motiliproteus sp. SC1-56]|uniref:peptidoglycan DD-metalloendopeptidase family protein n=1 Tax=Motiliproteus sp. SC1-56 TaxID=2799565 RepID=UPI00351C8AE3